MYTYNHLKITFKNKRSEKASHQVGNNIGNSPPNRKWAKDFTQQSLHISKHAERCPALVIREAHMRPDTDQDTPTRRRPSTTREDPAHDCPDHVGVSPPPSCSRHRPQQKRAGPPTEPALGRGYRGHPRAVANRDTAFRPQNRGAQLPEAPGGTGPRSGQCTPSLKAPVASQARPPWQWEPPGCLQQQNRRDQLSCNLAWHSVRMPCQRPALGGGRG